MYIPSYLVAHFEHLLEVLGHVSQLRLKRIDHIARVLLHVLAVVVLVYFYELGNKNKEIN